jgi:hypothetical protein
MPRFPLSEGADAPLSIRDHPHPRHIPYSTAGPEGAAEALYPGAGCKHGARRAGDDSGAKLTEQRGINFARVGEFPLLLATNQVCA